MGDNFVENRRTSGEIVGTALEVYGQGFGTFFTIAVAGQFLSTMGAAYLGEVSFKEPLANNMAMLVAGGAAILLGLIPQAIQVPALIFSVDDACRGLPVSVGTAFERATARLTWEAAWVNLISIWLVLGGLLAGIAPGILFSLWFCLADVAVVLERERDLGALRRSQRLVRGHVGKAAGLILVGVLASVLPGGAVRAVVPGVMGGFLSGLMGIFATPFQYAIHLLLYYDLKARKEGEPDREIQDGDPEVVS